MNGNEPSSAPFVHLHTHSEYSLVDGAIRLDDLIKKAKALGHPAVAVTDHANMFAAVEFYSKAKDAGIKAILGAEIYHQPLLKPDLTESDSNSQASAPIFQMVLLAASREGYHQLMKIVSGGYLENAVGAIPAVPADFLRQHAQDIIALSAGTQGEFGCIVQQLRQQFGRALDFSDPTLQLLPAYGNLCLYAQLVRDTFGPDGFYVELCDNLLPPQRQVLPDLVCAARHLQLPIVASANAHYLDATDMEAHAVLVAIKNDLTMSKIRDRRRQIRFHMLDNDEMQATFSAWPEALANTLKIADRCNVKLEFGNYVLPQFHLDTGETAAEALLRLAREGLEKRWPSIHAHYGSKWSAQRDQEYRDRLEFELKVIIDMGFPGYFLIVQDFINWAKAQGIPVGPGRGSGAGSLVAYSLRITDLDPIPYNLIFERFLNPERVSMPDFDVDFCQDRRDEVIDYVTQRYGSNNVAQITTFGKMLAKAVIRDVGRVLEISYSKIDRIAKLIPNELGITLKDALAREPRILEEARNDDNIAKLLQLAQKLEGLSRHTSVHAAGIVIADGGIDSHVPVYRAENGSLITQYEMKNAEKVGLVKFDFLGLKTLTVIDKAVTMIRQEKDPNFDITLLPLNDRKVYELISSGESAGVFQLESFGMQQLLTRLQPSNFEDIISILALFRPGPLESGMVDDFVERKHGRQKVEYLIPQLEAVLKDTYGTIVFQEQVQKIAANLASYSLGEADLLRRAMGKKKPEEMAKQKERFVAGCVANQIAAKTAEDLFELMGKFASYGFNKSHTAAYGLVSYQTAYLKAHFPEQFFAAIMTCDMDNTEKVVRYVQECRKTGIRIMPPDINRSRLEFDVPGPRHVGFGLAAIKGIGAASVRPIVEERERNGPFRTLTELARRVDLTRVGKKTLELLTQSGALDFVHAHRSAIVGTLAELVRYSENHHNAKSSGQRLLFDDGDAAPEAANDARQDVTLAAPRVSNAPHEWLKREKALLGTYLTGHPLDLYRQDMALFGKTKLNDLPKMVDRSGILIPCMLSDYFERFSKDGKRRLVVNLEDQSGEQQVNLYEDDIPAEMPPMDTPVMVSFKVSKGFDGGAPRIRVESITTLAKFRRQKVRGLRLNMKARAAASGHQLDVDLPAIRQICASQPGPIPLKIALDFPQGSVQIGVDSMASDPSDLLLQQLDDMAQGSLSVEYVMS